MTNDDLRAATRGQTVPGRFVEQVRARPDAVALRWRDPRDASAWHEWTWADYAARAARLAGALAELGVHRGDRVVLMLRNRPEFHVADVAVLLLGATPISIYNSSSAEQVAFIAANSGAMLAIVEDRGFLAKALAARASVPALRHVVVIESSDDDTHDDAPDGVLRWDALLDHAPVDLEASASVAQPEDLATVIYTSGTTGPPKGVMLDHANVCWTVESLRLALAGTATKGLRVVSYLPMAHIAERMTSHYQGLALGYEVTTCPEASEISRYLPLVRPEVFFAVPRVWEKIEAGVRAALSGDRERASEFERALEVGAAAADHRARGEELPAALAAMHEAVERDALAPLRAMLGLDALISAISGAAPLSRTVFDFFRALGLPLSEIYGLSETSGPMTWEPFAVRAGTVGPPIPGEEVRLAGDGEVLCRGGNVFRGYLDDPARTAEALDGDGWFHSGDIGELDEAGYLKIVDRKKELIITAGGKNISPANLEAALKSHALVGQACAIGDGRPFIGALLVLDGDVAPAWARQRGIDATTPAELARHPEVLEEIQRAVDEANTRFSRVERIKRFVVLHEEWLPDSDELTPTMKLKRRGVHTKYAVEIDSLYT